MRRLFVPFVALVLLVAAAGCDSTENEDLTDAEILIGSWTVVEVRDEEGDKTDVFEQGVQAFSATLTAGGEYTLVVDFVDPDRQDVPLAGTYTVDEGPNSLTLDVGPQVIPFTYDIESEDRIELSVSDQFIEPIFGTQPETYVGTIVFTIERQ